MSNQQNSSNNTTPDTNEFTPMSDQEQIHITGGGAAAMQSQCKDDEYWDPISHVCIKKDKPAGAAL